MDGDGPLPDAAFGRGRTVPLFPLSNAFLFPGCILPLHVFEPRYRQMVEDLLDGSGRMVIASVLEEHADEMSGSPPVHPIAGLGEIGRHERLEDGRFLIWLIGIARVKIREVESTRLYRQVEVEPLADLPVPPADAALLRESLQRAVLLRCKELLNLPDDVPISHLADLLLQRLALPPERMQRLYGELAVEKRARGALLEHARRPLPPRRKA